MVSVAVEGGEYCAVLGGQQIYSTQEQPPDFSSLNYIKRKYFIKAERKTKKDERKICVGEHSIFNPLGLLHPLQYEVSWETVPLEMQRCDRAESPDTSEQAWCCMTTVLD